jgi:hypothetical protein
MVHPYEKRSQSMVRKESGIRPLVCILVAGSRMNCSSPVTSIPHQYRVRVGLITS